ncbi:MAG: dTDP-4-amino-4,6-dideoxygalactose transaminase, partial [Bradymonadia bacterium]
MTFDPVPFHVPYRTGQEEENVAAALAAGSLAGNGTWTAQCQRALESLTGAPRVLLTHSCTAALELAAMLCGWGPGDEVIVPSFAFTSTAAAVARTGATLVFAEVDPSTMMLDLDDVARRISPKTRGIVPIHYAGLAAPLARLRELAEQHDLDLIEDAAQSIDARWHGEHLGTFGRFGCLSFHETKNIHCGLGGALIINDPPDIESAEFTWERGTNRSQFVRGMVDKYTWMR